MPIYEFVCPKHGKFEAIASLNTENLPCTYEYENDNCGRSSPRVDWSVPAKRNPDLGIQR